MKEKIIQTTPGVFMGISITRAHEGKSVQLYDGPSLIMEVSLEHPIPSGTDLLPGIEENIFFKHNLRVAYPEEAENDIEVFTVKN